MERFVDFFFGKSLETLEAMKQDRLNDIEEYTAKISKKKAEIEEIDNLINSQVIMRNFCIDKCTEIELIERCKEVGLSEENTMLAVEFFIKKTKQSEIAKRLCVEEHAISTRKLRLKQKLNLK